MKADHPSAESYCHAAWMLDMEPAALQAIAEVEAGSQGAFLDTGEPVILYERHLFHRLTAGRYASAIVPGFDDTPWAVLSNPIPGPYGPSGAQHRKLAAAVQLNRDAALKSCSWGLYQILGLNHVRAGHQRLQSFIDAMYNSVDDHLRALVNFIQSDERLAKALIVKDWATTALLYNGRDYAKNKYDIKMAEAYSKIVSGQANA